MQSNTSSINHNNHPLFHYIAFIIFGTLFWLLASLRYVIGFDYRFYEALFQQISTSNISSLFNTNSIEPGYLLLNWTVAHLGGDYRAFLFAFHLIFTLLVFTWIHRYSPLPLAKCLFVYNSSILCVKYELPSTVACSSHYSLDLSLSEITSLLAMYRDCTFCLSIPSHSTCYVATLLRVNAETKTSALCLGDSFGCYHLLVYEYHDWGNSQVFT